ncbi:type II secretion system minor pseudopilin GspI [Lysobacter sp. TLK-CK17T]|uniref:Type II secretion system protein I n=1 Tax=Marilutibacter chinensis TaxID=2912247 RepID=A0ABS9HWS3_9GAMM|nr:type II secretion system minor pseudopilin GspI [Lysobacter chinensis]
MRNPRTVARRGAHHSGVRSAGFSLIEVLVALAIFGLAVLGLLNLAGESTRSAVVIEERVLAGVVAENRAIEARVANADELAAMGVADEGRESAGDRDWRWRRTLAPADDTGLVRVDVVVMPADEDRIAAELSLLREAP